MCRQMDILIRIVAAPAEVTFSSGKTYTVNAGGIMLLPSSCLTMDMVAGDDDDAEDALRAQHSGHLLVLARGVRANHCHLGINRYPRTKSVSKVLHEKLSR